MLPYSRVPAAPPPRCLQVEVCRRLGWCNAVRLSVPNLHYRLNLDLRDDVAMLEKLLFLNCELSLNAGSNEYTTDEDNICCVRHLRIHDTLVEGPIPHNALAKHLVRRSPPSPPLPPPPLVYPHAARQILHVG